MAVRDDEVVARMGRARAIGLFRYQLIREPADPGLSSKARGRLVREIAAAEHTDPGGRRVRVSRDTLDRWIRLWRRGGFDALVPDPRQSGPRLPAEVLEMAVALKRENPARTATQVRRILRAQLGWSPGERTLQRHFAQDPQIAAVLAAMAAGGAGGEVFGRFEADRPNELWTGDALHGPAIGGRQCYLFAFLDEPSRATVGHLYDLARREVPEAEQGTRDGMPALIYRGKPLLSVMRAKAHIGLYPFSPDAVAAVTPLLDGFDHAKGTIRMRVERPSPDEVLRTLLAARRAQIVGRPGSLA